MQGVGPYQKVRVPVPHYRQVDVVSAAAAGQHRVQLLPALLTGHHAMHGVGSNTLRGVHGRGVTQFGSGGHVVGGQGDGAAAPYLPHSHTTSPAQVENGPPVAVFHPVGCSETQSAIIPTGDDQVTDAGRVTVGELDLLAGSAAGETVVAGALVEGADQLPGGGQHDRVEATAAVSLPGVENRVVVRSPTWTRPRSR